MTNKQWHEIMKILQGQQEQILTNNSGHPCYDYHTTPVVLASATTTMGTLSTLISLYLPQSPPLLWFRKRVKRFLSFTHAFSYILPIAGKFLPSATNLTEDTHKSQLHPCYRCPKTPQMVINIALYTHIMLQ